jgi:hypothetical protein
MALDSSAQGLGFGGDVQIDLEALVAQAEIDVRLVQHEPPEAVPPLLEGEPDDDASLRQLVGQDQAVEEPHQHGRIVILVSQLVDSSAMPPGAQQLQDRTERLAPGTGSQAHESSRRPGIVHQGGGDWQLSFLY